VVANLWLLTAEIVAQALDLDGVGSEPEELLLEPSELPKSRVCQYAYSKAKK